MNHFHQSVLEQVKPGMTVLDLGCGEMHLASKMADQGAFVTAVDIKMPEREDKRIAFYQTSIEEFTQRAWPRYDLVVMSNSLQFVDKGFAIDYLLPKMKHTKVMIKTFCKEPEPTLKGIRSLWIPTDLEFESDLSNYIENGRKFYLITFVNTHRAPDHSGVLLGGDKRNMANHGR